MLVPNPFGFPVFSANFSNPVGSPTLLFCDNLSTTYMVSNHIFHARAKHIELDYHFVYELVKLGLSKVQFIPSTDQLANVFTKGLPTSQFNLLWSKFVTQRPPSLRGAVSIG